MPAVISTSRQAVVQVEEQAPVPLVSTSDIQTYGNGHMHVVLFDFGYKKSIVHSLMAYGCRVTVVPYNTTLQTVEQLEPDGVLLSNGPGDPKQLSYYLPNILAVIERYPTLAICLGHQLVSLAYGGDTENCRSGIVEQISRYMMRKRKSVDDFAKSRLCGEGRKFSAYAAFHSFY